MQRINLDLNKNIILVSNEYKYFFHFFPTQRDTHSIESTKSLTPKCFGLEQTSFSFFIWLNTNWLNFCVASSKTSFSQLKNWFAQTRVQMIRLNAARPQICSDILTTSEVGVKIWYWLIIIPFSLPISLYSGIINCLLNLPFSRRSPSRALLMKIALRGQGKQFCVVDSRPRY